MHKSYLVTGGAGFIGSHLVESLLEAGYHVKVLDNFSTGLETNLSDLSKPLLSELDIIRGDIRDVQALDMAMHGVSGVFHLAALVSVPLSINRPDLSFDINNLGTHLVMDMARKKGVKRLVMASSAAVYGNNENLPLREEEFSIPLSPYGLDKSFGEQLGRLYATLYQINVTCLRFFNVFGPRQPPNSHYSGVVSIFAKNAAINHPPTIYGDGEQTRDFVFVKDVVNALMLAMQSQQTGFQLYNVGSGKKLTINQLWNMFRDISKYSINPTYLPAREGDIRGSLADISRIKKDLGFNPSDEINKELRETYEWLQIT